MEGKGNSLGDISTHFWAWEFRCPCKKCKRKKVRVSSLLLHKLEMMIIVIDRGLDYHKPFIVLSGNRCEEYNKKIGGHPNSAHIPKPDGEAVDIKVNGISPIDSGLIAEEIGGLRIGVAKWGIHVDVRPANPSRFWIYEGNIIYSVKIENENLLKFYQIIKGRRKD